MKVLCQHCGGERFRPGVIEPSPTGGVDVIMPCAECKKPNILFNERDPEMAQLLLGFFTAGPPTEGDPPDDAA